MIEQYFALLLCFRMEAFRSFISLSVHYTLVFSVGDLLLKWNKGYLYLTLFAKLLYFI